MPRSPPLGGWGWPAIHPAQRPRSPGGRGCRPPPTRSPRAATSPAWPGSAARARSPASGEPFPRLHVAPTAHTAYIMAAVTYPALARADGTRSSQTVLRLDRGHVPPTTGPHPPNGVRPVLATPWNDRPSRESLPSTRGSSRSSTLTVRQVTEPVAAPVRGGLSSVRGWAASHVPDANAPRPWEQDGVRFGAGTALPTRASQGRVRVG